MDLNDFNSKSALKLARVLFFAMLMGLIFFILVTLNITIGTLFFEVDFSEPFALVVLVMCLTVIPFGYLYSRRVFSGVNPGDTVREKYPKYQLGFLIRIASCEGVGLFAIICLMLTSNLYYLIFLALALVIFISNYPTPERIGELMDLSPKEIESFYI